MHDAYARGKQAAIEHFKVARYLSDADILERKIQKHMARDPQDEERRLTQKGREQGKFRGTVSGGLLGGLIGAGVTPLGAIPGAALGGITGRWLGGNIGERHGREEFNDRQELVEHLAGVNPDERRRRLEHASSEKRERERQRLLEDQRDYARSAYYRDLLRGL